MEFIDIFCRGEQVFQVEQPHAILAMAVSEWNFVTEVQCVALCTRQREHIQRNVMVEHHNFLLSTYV